MSKNQKEGFQGPVEEGSIIDTSSKVRSMKKVVAILSVGEDKATLRCISYREVLDPSQHVFILPRTTLLEVVGKVSEENLKVVKLIQDKQEPKGRMFVEEGSAAHIAAL